MKQEFRILACGAAIAAAVVLTACGGKETMASKSAAAFRESQQKGTAVGGEHGGHDAAEAGTMDHSTMTGMDNSTMGEAQPGMAGMDHSNMPGMKQPGKAQPGQQSMAGMDHSNMPGMKQPGKAQPGQQSMAGMDHSNMPGMQQPGKAQQGQQPMAGMDHNNMPGMQMTAALPTPEVKSAQAQPGQPAATLRVDSLDAPVATSIIDASRSVEMNQMMAGGGHGMTHGTYVQQDAGRDSVTPSQPMNHDMSGQTMAPAQPSRPRTAPAPSAKPQVRRDSMQQTAPASTADTYTCPMHPEVRSDRPGTCPKCGMTLVKKGKK